MLAASDLVAAMPEGAAREEALDHLYQGQSNDAYWHGLFGGVYISHMRLATWEHVIAAEDLAEGSSGRASARTSRYRPRQPRRGARLADEGQVVVVDLAEGAGIGSWDIRSVPHALAAVMRRRPEAYHRASCVLSRRATPGLAADDEATAPVSIHEAVRLKEPGAAEQLGI